VTIEKGRKGKENENKLGCVSKPKKSRNNGKYVGGTTVEVVKEMMKILICSTAIRKKTGKGSKIHG